MGSYGVTRQCETVIRYSKNKDGISQEVLDDAYKAGHNEGMKNKKSFFVVLFLLPVTLGTPSCEGGDSGWGGPTEPDNTEQIVTSLVVTPGSATVQLGQTVDFNASIRDQDGGLIQGSVQWSSASTSVATVTTTSGTATGRNVGTTEIRADYAGIRGVALLTVVGVDGN